MAYNFSYIFEAIDKFTPQMEAIKRSLDSVSDKVNNVSNKLQMASKKFKNFSESSKKVFKGASLYIAAPLIAAGTYALMASANIEKMQTSFISMLGSREKAAQLMKDMEAISSKSPFELNQIVEATRQLVAFGLPVKDAISKMQMLGDVAAGTNQPLSEIAEIYGRVQAMGKLRGDIDLYQMINRGIPIMQELQKMSKLTSQEIFKMASNGQISAKVIDAAFQRMTGKGGVFFHKTAYMAETLSGSLKQLKNNFYIAAAAFGDQINNALGLTHHINQLNAKLIGLTQTLNSFSQTNPELMKFLIWAGVALIGVIALGAAISTLAAVVSYAMAGLALIVTPVGLIIVAIGLWAAAIYEVYKNWDKVKALFQTSLNWILDKIQSIVGWFSKIGQFLGFGGGAESSLAIPSSTLASPDRSEVTIKQYLYDPGQAIANSEVTTSGGVNFDMGSNMLGTAA